MNRFFLTVVVVTLALAARAQSDFLLFARDSLDRGIHISGNPAGDWLITGTTNSFGNREQGLILTYDTGLNLLRARDYGGPAFDFLWGVAPAPDGGLIVTGFTNSYGHGGTDCWILRLDQRGDTLWTRAFGGSQNERAIHVIRTFDNHYVVVGETQSWGNGSTDVLLFKISATGSVLWHKAYGGTALDRGFNVVEAGNHDLIISGISENNVNKDTDMLLLRTTADGKLLWRKTFGGAGRDVCHYLLKTGNGNLLLAGYREYQQGQHEGYFVETDEDGNVVRTKSLRLGGDARIMACDLQPNSGYVCSGYARKDASASWDFLMVSVDTQLNVQDHFVHGGDQEDQAYGIVFDRKRGASIIVGHSFSVGNGRGDLAVYVWE